LLKKFVISVEQGKSIALECRGFIIKSLLPKRNLNLLWIKDNSHVILNRSLDLNLIQEYDANVIDLFFIERVNQSNGGIYECQIHEIDNKKNVWITNKIELKVLGISHVFKSKTFIFYQNIFMIIILLGTLASFIVNFYLSWNNCDLGIKKYIEMKANLKAIKSNE
jgi:hypothetical protein